MFTLAPCPPRALALALSLTLALFGVACAKKQAEAPAPEPAPAPAPPPVAVVQVTDVQLGTAVGADKRVTAATDTFKPTDTIYAAVITSGSATSATITARFTYQDGQLVNESSQTIAPTGADATEFHISKPDGWPVGNYGLEVLLDGRSVSTKAFKVQ